MRWMVVWSSILTSKRGDISQKDPKTQFLPLQNNPYKSCTPRFVTNNPHLNHRWIFAISLLLKHKLIKNNTYEYLNVYICKSCTYKSNKCFRTLTSLNKAIKWNYVVGICTFMRLNKACNSLYPVYLSQKWSNEPLQAHECNVALKNTHSYTITGKQSCGK